MSQQAQPTYMKRIILILLLIWLNTSVTQAAHIIGGVMTYQCMGPDANLPNHMRYRFFLKVYRDCQGGGAPFDSPNGAIQGHVTVYRGSNTSPVEIIYLEAPEISSLDPDEFGNPCLTVPPNVCVEEGVYVFTASLEIVDESYYIVYQRCCRNHSITNIWNPDEAGSTYSVEISPLAQSSCNNSPQFVSFPPIVICVNELLTFDHSATDMEGDQLVYEFCSPLMGGTQSNVAPNPDSPPPWNEVNFKLPTYSATNPLGGNPQVSIDPATGLISGVPDVQGQFVVGICVKEYRNGELLSVLQRDFQFNVAYCEPRVNAVIDGVDAGDQYIINSCGDTSIYIVNRSTDTQFIDEYYWEFDIPNVNLPLSFSTRNVTVDFPGSGTYQGVMILNPGTDCSDTAFVQVNIAPPIDVDFEFDYDTCIAGPVSFFDQSSNGNMEIVDWNWRFGDGLKSVEIDPIHEYRTPGLRDVELVVTNEIGCEDSITKSVNWYPVPPLIIIEPSAEEGCPPMPVTFTNLSAPVDETYDIIWDFGDGSSANAISPAHIYQGPGTFSVSVDITSPIGCYTSKTFPNLIFVDSFPEAAFSYTPPTGISNFAPDVQFYDQSRHARFWEWTFNGEDYTFVKDPAYTFRDTGLQLVELIITHHYGCQDTARQWVDVEPQITFFMPNAFTPNEDAKNEEFRGGGYFRGIRDYEMTIFDRWGGVLFQSRNPEEGWNGRRKNTGKAVPNGVYLYLIRFTGPRGQPHEYQGFATLIR